MFPRCLRHEGSAILGSRQLLESAHDASLVVNNIQLKVTPNSAAAGIQLEGVRLEGFCTF